MALLWLPGASFAGEKSVAEEILDILRAQGSIDEVQYRALVARARAEEADATPPVSASHDDWTVKWSNGISVTAPDEKHSVKFGGRLMADYAYFDADDEVSELLGEDLDGASGTEFRRARLFVSGTLWERIKFKAQYDFAGGDADLNDAFIDVTKLPVVGNVRLGHFKEPFSLEQITSSKYNTFMERALPNVFVPARNVGVMAFDQALEGRATWAVGVFRDADGFGEAFGKDAVHNVTARVTGLPWYQDEGRRLLHLGLSYSHLFTDKDAELRFRQRPEAHLSPVRFVDTGDFSDVDAVELVNPELALVYGPFALQGEYMAALVDLESGSDPDFDGFYLEGGWFLTGENRVYKQSLGAFDRVKPARNFDGEGGLGAWELALRYSTLDLEDGAISGGELDNWTVGLNWYLNPNVRMMLNYVNADLDRGGVDEATDIFQTRVQIDF